MSPAAVTKACKHSLSGACLTNGRVDGDHPAVVEYLAKKGVTLPPQSASSKTKKASKAKPTKARRTPDLAAKTAPKADPAPTRSAHPALSPADNPPDIDDVLDLSVREVVDRWGSVTAFKDWLDARKKIADIREKDLKNDETEGQLIDRELVKVHIFGAIEAGNRRLLTDAPKTISRRLYGLAKSGSAIEEAEKIVGDIIGSHLKPVKATAIRVLKNA